MRMRRPSTSRRCLEPVTVPAAPRKVRCMRNDKSCGGAGSGARHSYTSGNDERPLIWDAYRIIVAGIKTLSLPAIPTPRGDPAMDDKKMPEETSPSVSRRGFIKGVIAAGAVASSSAYLFRTTPLLGQPSAPGSVERLITLNVNGQDRRVDVMKQETLAMTLRYKLGLTGTKLGCDRAECGACTVLIDDVPHYSCSVLTHTTRGKKVQTIEGLADPATGKLSAVQQGVIDEQGFQCAFCMPGFVMAATGYLKTNPSPTRQQLAHGVSGNLCRCQDYDKILTALMRGAEHMRNA